MPTPSTRCATVPVSMRALSAIPLHAIHPNPARAGATIRYDLARRGNAALRVYDAQGRCVRVLAEGWAEPGRRTLSWDARDARGAPVAAGLYFVRLQVADF